MKKIAVILLCFQVACSSLIAQSKPQAKPQNKKEVKAEKECKCKDQTFKYDGKKTSNYLSSDNTFKIEDFALLKNDTVYFSKVSYKIEAGKEIVTAFQRSKMAVKDFANGQLNSEVSINIKKNSANQYVLTLAPEPFNFKKNAIIEKIDMCDISPNPRLKTGKETFIMGIFEKEADAKAFLDEVVKVMNKYKKN